MKRRPPSDDPQAIVDAIISTKWTVAIIKTLLEGPVRFSRIRTAIPAISANTLTSRLRALEGQDVVRRTLMPPPAECEVMNEPLEVRQPDPSYQPSLNGDRHLTLFSRF